MWPYLQLKNNDCFSLVLVLKYTPCFMKGKKATIPLPVKHYAGPPFTPPHPTQFLLLHQ